jgi:hypothetical protein
MISAFHESIFNQMGYAVACGDRHIAAHAHMEIREECQSAFANAAFFHIFNSRDGLRTVHDFLNRFVRSLFIEQFAEGSPQHAKAIESDNAAGKKRSPIVCTHPTRPSNQGYEDAYCGGKRSEASDL